MQFREAADYWHKRLEMEKVKLNGPPFLMAESLAHPGETEQAVTLLERTCDNRSSGGAYFNVFPNLDPLRDHPRFKALLRRARLAAE